MPIPEGIRRVPRPKNTVVIDSGHDGPLRYAVRQRAGVKYGPQGQARPINGSVIGHICGGSFVPLGQITRTGADGPDVRSYGAAAFVHSEGADILQHLLSVYLPQDAYAILVIAMLRAIKPEIKSRRFSTEYNRTFIGQFYPGVHVSENRVSKLLNLLGQDGGKREAFYQLRQAAVEATHHLVIDGVLKQDTSTINSLSAFSYKGRVKGCRDISVIYAYDLEKMEPVCAEAFAGNCIDASTFAAFIRDRDIQQGIIVADKGFPPSKISAELQARPGLHFLIPIKRSDHRIKSNGLLDFQGVISGIDRQVGYCKRQIRGGRFLYAYKDFAKARAGEWTFLERMKKDPTLTQDVFSKKSAFFGVIVLESDQDLSPLDAYLCYENRWQIELVFDSFKNDEGLDRTDVQGDYSVWGNEFINFIATVLTCRMMRRAQRAGLLAKSSFKDLLEDLACAWRKAKSPIPPKSGDEYWQADFVGLFTKLEALNLSTPGENSKAPQLVTPSGEVIPRKSGRPRTRPVFVGPKRPRGRPRRVD